MIAAVSALIFIVAAACAFCVWTWVRMLRRVEARYLPARARRPALIRADVFGAPAERVVAGPACAACGTMAGPLAASFSGGLRGEMFCIDIRDCKRRRGVGSGGTALWRQV
jgi:hypothetical protein